MQRHVDHRGFSLVEVMVALAIVAVALAAGAKASGALTNNAQRLMDVTLAQWCADNELANLRLARQFPGVGDADFTCKQMDRELRGQVSVRPTPNPNFRRVDARLSDESGQPILSLSTILGR